MQKPQIFQGQTPTFPTRPKEFEKFVKETSAQVKQGAKRIVVKDPENPSLRLVVGPRGAQWFVKFSMPTRADGKRPEFSGAIGKLQDLSLSQARQRLDEMRKAAAQGGQIEGSRAKRAKIRNELVNAATEAARVADAIARMTGDNTKPLVTDWALLAHASLDQCAIAFCQHGISPALKPANAVTKKTQIKSAIQEIGAGALKPADLTAGMINLIKKNDQSRSSQRQKITAIKQLYVWLIEHGAADNQAARNVKLPAPVEPRDRVYSGDEIKRLWQASAQIGGAKQDYLQLLLLLPLRRGELATLKASDFEQKEGMLTLKVRKENSKTKTEHILPIVGTALEIVTRRLKGLGLASDDLLLPLSTTDNPMTAWKSFQASIAKVSKIDDFLFHSTRHTFQTEVGEHGIGDWITADACLNHAASTSRQGAGRGYDHSKKLIAKASLLAAWDRLIMQAVKSGRWPREEDQWRQEAKRNFSMVASA